MRDPASPVIFKNSEKSGSLAVGEQRCEPATLQCPPPQSLIVYIRFTFPSLQKQKGKRRSFYVPCRERKKITEKCGLCFRHPIRHSPFLPPPPINRKYETDLVSRVSLRLACLYESLCSVWASRRILVATLTSFSNRCERRRARRTRSRSSYRANKLCQVRTLVCCHTRSRQARSRGHETPSL